MNKKVKLTVILALSDQLLKKISLALSDQLLNGAEPFEKNDLGPYE